MIDERELTRLMEQLANNYELPENGRQSILDAAEQDNDGPRLGARPVGLRQRRRLLLPAAAVVALFAVGAAVFGTLGQSSVDTASVARESGDAGTGGGSAAKAGTRSPLSYADADGFAGSMPSSQSGGQVAGLTQSQSGPQPQPQPVPSAAASPGPSPRPAPASAPGPASGGAAADSGARVVKTGELQMEVRRGRFGTAIQRLTALAVGRGGYIAQTQTAEGDNAPTGTITLRVPAGEFDAVVAEVRRLGKVVSATTRGQDVTSQYTDIEARLRALNASRDQILTVLSKATTVGDILAVQERLNSVQVQIEQLQGQQKVLDDQTTFGTVAVQVAEPGGEGVGPPTERLGLSGAWDDARRGFGDGLEAIVAGSGTALVVVMALAVLALAGRAAWLLTRRRLI